MGATGNNGYFEVLSQLNRRLSARWTNGDDSTVVDGNSNSRAYLETSTGSLISSNIEHKFSTLSNKAVKSFYIKYKFNYTDKVWSEERWRFWVYLKKTNKNTEEVLYDSGERRSEGSVNLDTIYTINDKVDYVRIYVSTRGYSIELSAYELKFNLLQTSHFHGYKNGIKNFIKDDSNSSPLKIGYNSTTESILLVPEGHALDSGFRIHCNDNTYAIAAMPD